jgi:hypothetical protein
LKIHSLYFQDRVSKTLIRVSFHSVFLILNIKQIYRLVKWQSADNDVRHFWCDLNKLKI